MRAGMLLKDKNPTEVVVLRSESDQIAFGVRSDSVRRPIRLRSESDQIAFGVRSDSVRERWIFARSWVKIGDKLGNIQLLLMFLVAIRNYCELSGWKTITIKNK